MESKGMGNKKQYILTLVLLLVAVLKVSAQNRIDRLVESFSTLGSATFTSVVERNPQTRQVQKVVKVLEIRGSRAGELHEAFVCERHSGSYSETRNGQEVTQTLVTESPKQSRIYLLQLSGNVAYRTAKCTTIIKMKGL